MDAGNDERSARVGQVEHMPDAARSTVTPAIAPSTAPSGAPASPASAPSPSPSPSSPSPLPFVSVVIPAYNRAAFLHECLGSLFAQTYQRDRFEIIVVDDGSTDGTAEIARALGQAWAKSGDGRLRVIEKANGGPASARNAGIHAATGEIVAFTDSDCIADPDWLEQLVAVLTRHTDAAGVGGPLTNVLPSGWVARFLDGTAFYRHRVRHGKVDYLLTGNAAFRRDALLTVDGFAEQEGAWGEDADLSFRLRQSGYRLLLAPAGRVTHHGSPVSLRGLARELYRYGYGNSVLSRNWTNGRTPLVEFARHAGGMLLAPALALRAAPRVGLWRALSFCPLYALEHGAFAVGLLHGEARVRMGTVRGAGLRAHTEKAQLGGRGDSANSRCGRDERSMETILPQLGLRGATATNGELPLVSVVMPVRNEAAHIARSLGAVLAQDYPRDRIEVLLVDGQSDDDTLGIALSLPNAERVRVVCNPKRVQAAGLNLALRHARGEVIVRVDGHTVIAPDYVTQCVTTLLRTGAANVGGRMDARVDTSANSGAADTTPTGQAIALATSSRFGVPTAFHTSHEAQETDTVYMGAWPRAVLERIGGFDEGLRANEDYELNFRIRQAGGRIYLNPAIRSTYFPRGSLGSLARQYAGYGQGKARMLAQHPTSLRPRQLVAPAFVASAALGLLCVRIRAGRALWLAMLAAYAGLNIMTSTRLMHRAPTRISWRVAARLPLVFLTIHVAWGTGFWTGMLARLGARLVERGQHLLPAHDASDERADEGTDDQAPGQVPIEAPSDAISRRAAKARRW